MALPSSGRVDITRVNRSLHGRIPDEAGASADRKILNGLRVGMSTIPGALLKLFLPRFIIENWMMIIPYARCELIAGLENRAEFGIGVRWSMPQ
jgi:hypothetical protein